MAESIRDMHERLVDHLDGVVDPEVEQLIASDPAWAKAWQDIQETKAAVLHFGLKEKVSGIHSEMKRELVRPAGGTVRRMIRPLLSVAAALILIVGGYFLYTFYTLDPNKVFEANYTAYDAGTLRGVNEQPSALETAYRKNDKATVIQLFESQHPSGRKDRFLAGVTYLDNRNFAQAATIFKTIISDSAEDGLFKDESEYYLALALIGTHDYKGSLPLLKKIRDDKQHPYHQEVSDKMIREVRMLGWK